MEFVMQLIEVLEIYKSVIVIKNPSSRLVEREEFKFSLARKGVFNVSEEGLYGHEILETVYADDIIEAIEAGKLDVSIKIMK